MNRAEMDRYLPGGPSKRMISQVRSHLRLYGIKPVDKLWRLAWEWAANVADSYSFTSKRHWPAATEIASQYVFLLLAEMREGRMLRLPYRAPKHVPSGVLQLLSQSLQAPVWKLPPTRQEIFEDAHGSTLLIEQERSS